jgi:hypothetical protein
LKKIKVSEPKLKEPNRYEQAIAYVFETHYEEGLAEIPFSQDDLRDAAQTLSIEAVKNIYDNLYSMRHGRMALPPSILAKAPKDKQWIIVGKGRGKYAFRLFKGIVRPNPSMPVIKIPDSTPEIIAKYALNDEQALLAKIRYNRSIDLFLGLTAYSLQNHLRSTVRGIGQIEIDEIYAAVNRRGAHFVLPVQAKDQKEIISPVQGLQDVRYCEQKFPALICRPIAAQFMPDDVMALFELSFIGDDEVQIQEEKHFKLVPASKISDAELRDYKQRTLQE